MLIKSKGTVYIRGRDHKKQSPFKRPTLADQRLIRKCAVKIGLNGAIRKTRAIFRGISKASKRRTSGLLEVPSQWLMLAFIDWKKGDLHLPTKSVGKSPFSLQSAAACSPRAYADACDATNADSGFANIESPESRLTEPLGQSQSQQFPSISVHHLGSNIPALQRHLVFSFPQDASPNRKADTRSCEYLSRSPCSTPITPLDKILRTPPYPPSVRRPGIRNTLATIARTPESLATFSSSSKYSLSNKAICKVSENIRRRLSIVAPPDAMPMHAPRRLSYSHTFGKPRSPLRRRNTPASLDNLDSCTESDLLASPLVILPSSSHKQFLSWTDSGVKTLDISFSSVASPRQMKV